MKKINSETDLKIAILRLKSKQINDLRLLKDQLNAITESLKPINLAKSTLKKATTPQSLKKTILSMIVVVGSSYLTKVIIRSTARQFLSKKIFKIIILLTLTHLIIRKRLIISIFFKKINNIWKQRCQHNANKSTQHDYVLN